VVQPILSEVLKGDLVILEQANKFVLNHFVVLLSMLGLKRVAFFGHGRNRQQGGRFSEWYKKAILKRVDWWFAYTQGTSQYLVSQGVDQDKITVVQNSVDLSKFKSELEMATCDDLAALRTELHIMEWEPVGLYCGGLHSDKKLSFLLSAAKKVRERVANFQLIVVGGGVESGQVEVAARDADWIHYVGPKFGTEKARYFRISDVFLCPGLVGLGILDAFCAGLPLLTTRLPIHSPEIEYLEPGVNGLMTEPEIKSFTDALAYLLMDRERLSRMSQAAQESAARYGMDAMVQRFKNGIVECLAR